MDILSFSNEILLCTADAFEFTWDINSFALVNRRLYKLINPYMHRRDVGYFSSSALGWALLNRSEHTTRKMFNVTLIQELDENDMRRQMEQVAMFKGHDVVMRVLLD